MKRLLTKLRIPDAAQQFLHSAADFLMPFGHTSIQLKRVFKAALLTTICFMFSCIDKVDNKLGNASYLCALISVSMHPGRRLGAMMQSLAFGLTAVLIGLPYSLFAHFCAKKTYDATHDLQKAYGIFVIFLFIVLCVFGYVRSVAPRFFSVVFVWFLICHFSFLLPITTSYRQIAYDYSVPFIIGIGLSFFVSVTVFPEFGSTYIGTTVLSAMHELQVMFSNTSYFFTSFDTDDLHNVHEHSRKLAALLSQKKKVRTSLAACDATMLECTYEFSYSFMAPQELKPLLKKMRNLNVTVNALHVACELALGVFAGYQPQENQVAFSDLKKDSDPRSSSHNIIESTKPEKESSYANKELLVEFIKSVNKPVHKVTEIALQALNETKCVLAYTYDANVNKLKFSNAVDATFVGLDPSEVPKKYEVSLQKIDDYLKELALVNESFSTLVKSELGKISDKEFDLVYLVPQEEYFVLSLFLLNFRETTLLVSQILSQVRSLLEIRQSREANGFFGRRMWFSVIHLRRNWSKYLKTGSADLQEGETASIAATKQTSKESGESKPSYARSSRLRRKASFDTLSVSKETVGVSLSKLSLKVRLGLIRVLDLLRERRLHLLNAFRTALTIFLVTFPGYSVHMRQWFNNTRGSWVGFAAIIALETNVGATGFGYVMRTISVVLASAWGYALYAAGNYGNDRYVMTVMLFIGVAPMYYMMLLSPHGRAFLIGVVSLVVVPLSTLRNHGIPGTILINFGKRCVAMLIGGGAAMIVNVAVFPQKARVHLVNQLVVALKTCQLIQIQLALGVNGENSGPSRVSMVRSESRYNQYHKKAKSALAAAESLLKVALTEPRLKGSFKTHADIYTEIIFVLHQILDRYNNIKFLRQQYGSAVLDELSPNTYLYRREVYATIIALFRTTEEALFSKKPIPQYVPSPRIAHIRVVNAVRESLVERKMEQKHKEMRSEGLTFQARRLMGGPGVPPSAQHEMLRNKYMGWSATSVATEEVIQYVEELTNLAKFLVGSQNFEHGFLARPLYAERVRLIREDFQKQMGNGSSSSDSSSTSFDPDGTPLENEKTEDVIGNCTVEEPPRHVSEPPSGPDLMAVYTHPSLRESFVLDDEAADANSLVSPIPMQPLPHHFESSFGSSPGITPGFGIGLKPDYHLNSRPASPTMIPLKEPIPDGGVLSKQATLEFPKELKRHRISMPIHGGLFPHSFLSGLGSHHKQHEVVPEEMLSNLEPSESPPPERALRVSPSRLVRTISASSTESRHRPRRGSILFGTLPEEEEDIPLTLQKITTRKRHQYHK